MSAKRNRRADLWFKISIASGLLLALTSVVVAVVTYRFVAGHLSLDHLNREAGKYASILEYKAQEEAVGTPAELAVLLQGVLREEADEVAWLRVLGRGGGLVAEAGGGQSGVFDERALQDVLELR